MGQVILASLNEFLTELVWLVDQVPYKFTWSSWDESIKFLELWTEQINWKKVQAQAQAMIRLNGFGSGQSC